MEQSIQVFKSNISKLDENTVYATNEVVEYFFKIRDAMERIAYDLSTLLTGASPLTPGNLELSMQLTRSIDELEEFLKHANRNSAENASKVIGIEDILIRFDGIRSLMRHPNTNGDFRRDTIQLFIKTGNLYPEEQVQEFIGYLNEEELKHILQIVKQEETLIEKDLTNSPIHFFANQRINELRTKSIAKVDREIER